MPLVDDLDAAHYQKLSTTAGTAFYGTRIHAVQAPKNEPRPYVVYQHYAGGDTNVSPSRIVDVVYKVEAIADTGAEAATLAGYIEAALHDQALTIPNGWSHIATTQEGLLNLVENYQGEQRYRAGGFFRTRMSR